MRVPAGGASDVFSYRIAFKMVSTSAKVAALVRLMTREAPVPPVVFRIPVGDPERENLSVATIDASETVIVPLPKTPAVKVFVLKRSRSVTKALSRSSCWGVPTPTSGSSMSVPVQLPIALITEVCSLPPPATEPAKKVPSALLKRPLHPRALVSGVQVEPPSLEKYAFPPLAPATMRNPSYDIATEVQSRFESRAVQVAPKSVET